MSLSPTNRNTRINMTIAIPLANGQLHAHFGHADQFALVETDPHTKTIIKTTLLQPPPHEPGALPRWLHQQGANVIIAGGMGQRALQLFAEKGIQVRAGLPGSTVETLVLACLNGALGAALPGCNHQECH
jgi:predicted Fe-Mo cluster-binding NifX family protein